MYPNVTNTDRGLLHKELSFKIVGLCFSCHNKLGQFCKERQYCDELESLFKQNNISYLREANLHKIALSGPKGNFADFIIENSIILEAKAKSVVTKEDYYQTQRYLQATNLELALLVNFRVKYLHPKRILNINYKKD